MIRNVRRRDLHWRHASATRRALRGLGNIFAWLAYPRLTAWATNCRASGPEDLPGLRRGLTDDFSASDCRGKRVLIGLCNSRRESRSATLVRQGPGGPTLVFA